MLVGLIAVVVLLTAVFVVPGDDERFASEDVFNALQDAKTDDLQGANAFSNEVSREAGSCRRASTEDQFDCTLTVVITQPALELLAGITDPGARLPSEYGYDVQVDDDGCWSARQRSFELAGDVESTVPPEPVDPEILKECGLEKR